MPAAAVLLLLAVAAAAHAIVPSVSAHAAMDGSGAASASAATALYKDASQPIDVRVADLLSKMTLEEKVNQTLNDFSNGAFGGGIPTDEKMQMVIASEGMRYLFKFCSTTQPKTGPDKDENPLTACINTINHFQTLAKEKSRLGIPISFSLETLHGTIYAPQLPMPINLGCSWNESLVERGFAHTAAALTMVGGNVGLSPVVNMFPDPRFGRLQEGFSEDPYLSGKMGVAAVRGMQGPQSDPDGYLNNPQGVSCVVKHYLGYGHAEQGGIDGGPATLDEQTLRERYLPPWKAIADEGLLRGIMCSQSAVNHIPMHMHKRLITGVLRNELNFTHGFVHSDGGCVISCNMGVYQLASTEGEAAALSLHAGVDMDFAGCSYSHLEEEVKAGRVNISDLDRAVSNVLRVKFATGLFDRPANVTMRTPEELDTPAFRQVVREAAEQSIVLLINKKTAAGGEQRSSMAEAAATALPLKLSGSGKIGSMLLAGPLIDDASSQNGGYSHGGAPTTTILAGAKAAAAAGGFTLTTLLGTSNGTSGVGDVVANDAEAIDAAVAAAAKVDVAVLVLGDNLQTCAEMGDRSSLSLLGGQQELLRRVATVAKKTVVVLIGGRQLTFESGYCVEKPKLVVGAAEENDDGIPKVEVRDDGLTFPWDPSESFGAACSQPSLLNNVSALLAAWRPGAEGGPALFNLLGGAVNPSAHLSVAWPRSVGGIGSQVPYLQQFALHYREQYQDEPTTPLFRFGYGLSYSNLTTSAPRVASPNVSVDDTITVEVDVTNNAPAGQTAGGSRDATTVVQLYFQQQGGSAAVIRYYQQLSSFYQDELGTKIGKLKQKSTVGATKTVQLELKIADLAYWDNDEEGYLGAKGWRLGRSGKRATYVLMAGLSAAECTGAYGTTSKPSGCDLPGVRISFDVP